MLELIITLFISLLLTEVFELMFAFVSGIRSKREVVLILLINMLTNPPAVFIVWLCKLFITFDLLPFILLLEILIVITEGLIYSKYSEFVKRPFIFAAAINITSFSLGLAINVLGGIA